VDSFYRPGLDILRALAFLLVFVAHGLVSEINRPTQAGAIARMGEFGVSIFSFLARTSLPSCCCGKSGTPAPSTFQRFMCGGSFVSGRSISP
jgi:hypothetical protein